MKQLILDAVRDLLEDDVVLDEMVGRLITEPNRPTSNYPLPLDEIEDEWKEKLGILGGAETTLQAFFSGEALLRRVEGVSFAWSV